MPELVVEVPKELGEEIQELHGMEEALREFIRLKVFEFKLQRSKELQRFVLEALASKSKLTDEAALELGRKVDEGMLQELKEKRLV